jgi:O-antigen/teichoic acid export membrane protein
LILELFGQEYSDEGAMLLRLLALGVLPHGVNAVCLGVARVRRQLRVIFLLQAAESILFVALAVVFLPAMGIAGIGIAFLAGQSIVALVAFATQIYPLLRDVRPQSPSAARVVSSLPDGAAPVGSVSAGTPASRTPARPSPGAPPQ